MAGMMQPAMPTTSPAASPMATTVSSIRMPKVPIEKRMAMPSSAKSATATAKIAPQASEQPS